MLKSRNQLLTVLVLFSIAVAAATWTGVADAARAGKSLGISRNEPNVSRIQAIAESGEPDAPGNGKSPSSTVGIVPRGPATPGIILRWACRIWMAQQLGARL